MKGLAAFVAGFVITLALALSAQEAHIRVGGAWEELDEIHVQVSSTWEEVQQGWIRVGGAWEQFYQNWVVNLDGESISDAGASAALSAVTLLDDGTVECTTAWGSCNGQIDASTDWIIPNGSASGDYDVLCTLNSGTLSSGDTCDGATWLALSSSRSWAVSSGSGTVSANITLAIRFMSGSPLDTGVYALSASAS